MIKIGDKIKVRDAELVVLRMTDETITVGNLHWQETYMRERVQEEDGQWVLRTAT